MRKLTYQIPPEYGGRKVIHYLRGAAGCSATLVKQLKHWEDGILLDGNHVRTIDRLRAGAVLTITLHDAPACLPTPTGGPIPAILYEDEDVLVFDKPAGMPCHPSRGHQDDTLANAFAALCARRGEAFVFRAVNRLDRNTTGAVVVAKNARAAALLAGKVDKVYLAVTAAPPQPACGAVNAPISRPAPRDIRRAVRADGQRAVTVYRTLYTDEAGRSLVRCELPTGRTHQIRVHMAYLGCPLLGDDLYGGDCREMGRQALHCARVRFCLPGAEAHIVDAPVPKDMQNFSDKAGAVW